MIDPETARQAADEALAEWNAAWLNEHHLWGHRIQAAGDALAVLVPQLLDQLAELRAASADNLEFALETAIERDALGERCRQFSKMLTEAEGLLSYWASKHNGQEGVEFNQATEGAFWEHTERARAALGDAAETKPSLGIGTNTTVGRGDAAVSPEPGQSLMEIEYAERFAAVEPPQPETLSERDK